MVKMKRFFVFSTALLMRFGAAEDGSSRSRESLVGHDSIWTRTHLDNLVGFPAYFAAGRS